jgi:hypothetical protein
MSLVVILCFKVPMGEDAFKDHGWRYPFLISIILIFASIYIRLKLGESPMFQERKDAGKLSKNPIFESFGNAYNLRFVAMALFCATMGI